jgi:hypothetical protein
VRIRATTCDQDENSIERKEKSMNRTILRVAVSSACFIQMLSAGDNAVDVRHTVVVESGEAAPAGGIYVPFSFLNLSFNARHAIAFDAVLTGPPFMPGIFVADGKTISTIALGATPSPAGPSFGSVLDPFISRDGAVIFVDQAEDIFRSDGKTIISLARVGDSAPDGGIVTQLGQHMVNDAGVVAYFAGLSGPGATQAILRTAGPRTATIARDDMAPPTGGRFTALGNLNMNNAGQVAFNAEMTGGLADHGVFRGQGGNLTPVFVTHQTAPGGGTIDDCGDTHINSHGQVLATCTLTETPSVQSVLVGDGTRAVVVAMIGGPAPKGGNYARFTSAALNDRGEVAFQARLTTGASGMFRVDGLRTTTLALSGMSAPGTSATFQSFGDLVFLGNDGRVMFAAKLTTGVGGVDSSNNKGIWIGTSERDLRLLVRTGEMIGGKVLTGLPFDGSDASGHSLLMNENSVLWRGSFGLTKAVIVSEIHGDDDRGKNED